MPVTTTSCTFLKEWTGKDGKTGKIYDIVFSDGTKGQSFAEIANGTSKDDLEVTPNGNYPDKIKAKAKNVFAGGGGRPKTGNESFACSYSKDVFVALVSKMDKPPKSEDAVKVILAMADSFYNWLESKRK